MSKGDIYARDVIEGSSSTRQSFSFVRETANASNVAVVKEKRTSEHLDPKKAMRNGWECLETDRCPIVTPIVLMIDLTSSRGEDIINVFDKVPLLIGQTVMHGYADVPHVSICGVGDYKYDRFSVQIGDFESDLRIDRNIKTLIVEEGGGGNGLESYLTALYGYAYHSFLDCNARGKKGYMFILGDEGFYPSVTKEEIKKIYGTDVQSDFSAEKIFADVQKKYNVFFIYIVKNKKERRKGIDAEIKKRVEGAGGMYTGVDWQVSAIWYNRNDLDLHCMTPDGTHIYFLSHCKSKGDSPAHCGAYLDVDMNVQGESTKPVEHIRCEEGKGKAGRYIFWIENFRYHETNRSAVEFKVEIEIDGETTYFEGRTPAGMTGGQSKVMVADFVYDPTSKKKKVEQEPTDPYAAYDDDMILNQWRSAIPEDNVLVITTDPKAIVDVMLGVIAMTEEKRTLEEYDGELKDRYQSDKRRQEVRGALRRLSNISTSAKPDAAKLPKKRKK